MREVKCYQRKSKVVETQGSSLRETEADRNWEKRERRPKDTKRQKGAGGIGRKKGGGVRQDT